MRAALPIICVTAAALMLPAALSAQVRLAQVRLAQVKPVLDYGFYKAKVEPIFLAKKPGHTRCVVCHAESNNNFNLQKLEPGANGWTDAQSRRNFAMIEKLVNPGDPETSLLTHHPLAPEAGGDAFHSGGRQFTSKDDPDWKALAAFVSGAKVP